MADRKSVITVIIIAALTVAAYSSSINNGFCYDDNNELVNNPWVTSFKYVKDVFTKNAVGFDVTSTSSYYRPLPYVTQMAVYAFFGLQSWSYHLINIFFHTGATIIIFILTAGLLTSRIPQRDSLVVPAMASLIFGLHPIHTEVVMWISALSDAACTVFYLAALLLHVRATSTDHISLSDIISAVLFFIALLYKEIAITLPIMIIAYDLITKPKGKPLAVNKYILYFLVATVYMIMRLNALHGMVPSKRYTDLTTIQTIYNSLAFFLRYVYKILLPTHLTVFYPFHPITFFNIQVAAALLIVILFIAIILFCRKRKPIVSIGLILFSVSLLPALYLPALSTSPFSERYLYLPSAGFVLVVAGVMNTDSKKRMFLVYAIITVLLILYSASIHSRSRAWANDITLWQSALKYAPDNATCHRYLAYAYSQNGQMNEALAEYKEAIRLDPKDPIIHLNLGTVYQQLGEVDLAIWQYMNAITLKRDLYEAYANLGTAYLSKGQVQEALESCGIALQLLPSNPNAHACKGIAYVNLGRVEEAILEFEEALRLVPRNVIFRENLQKAYQLREQSIRR